MRPRTVVGNAAQWFSSARGPAGRRAAAVLTLLLGALLPGSSLAGPCSCSDVPAIKYRMKEIRTLVQGYQTEIARIGPGPGFTLAAYRAFQDGPQQSGVNALKASTPSAPTTWGGATDPTSCNSRFPPAASPCLLEALRRHEGHHANACRLQHGQVPSIVADYRDGAPLAAAYEEEIVAYTVELDFLQSQLDALPETCRPPGWILELDVKIRGSGSKVGHTWKLEHVYSGKITLDRKTPSVKAAKTMSTLGPAQLLSMTPQQIAAFKQSMTQDATWRPKVVPAPVDVAIDDQDVRFVHEPGEGSTYENTTTTRTWKGSGRDELRGAVAFEENVGAGTYNVEIDLRPASRSQALSHDESEELDRTPYGYGKAPTHEVRPKPTQKMGFSVMRLPEVKGLLTQGTVRHAQDQPLQLTGGMVQFDSGWVSPDPLTPPFSGLPEAATKLKVRVYYRLSRPE